MSFLPITRTTPRARPAAASVAAVLLALAASSAPIASLHAQGNGGQLPPPSKEMVDRGRRMLVQVRKDLEKYYYDSTFHGLNIDSLFHVADTAIIAAPTNNHIMGALAQFVSELRDSHTNFYPPTLVARVDYGFRMQFIGDTCYVVGVKRGSDAEKQGLKIGDALLTFDRFRLERNTLHTLEYIYNVLSPRPVVRLGIRGPDGAPRELQVSAKITKGERIIDFNNLSTVYRLIEEWERMDRVANHQWKALDSGVVVWRMRHFDHGDEENIKDVLKDVRKARALVLDLRNNPGGSVRTLKFFIGQFFDREVPIYTERTRKGIDTVTAKPVNAKDPWRGMLVILVNSGSASASEVTARALQLESRAIIVGDRTMGAVVTSRYYPREVGFGRVLNYGTMITVSDVIMSDGNRLENVGVIPDEIVLPSGADLASKRDPALSRALQIVGVTMSPEEAAEVYREAKLR